MKKMDKEKNFISAIVYVNNNEERIEEFLNHLIDVLEENFLNGSPFSLLSIIIS